MSKVFKRLAFLDPIANTIVSGSATGLVNPTASITATKQEAAAKDAEKAAAAEAQLGKGEAPGATVAEKAKEKVEEVKKDGQVANRKEELRAAAGAAGATATASDYDLLGTAKGTIKKKQAAKALLGS
jgi:hypothetical protein